MNLCLMIREPHFISNELLKYSTFCSISAYLAPLKFIQGKLSFINEKHNCWIAVFRIFLRIENIQADFFFYSGYFKRNVHIDEIVNIDWLTWYLIQQCLISTAASPQITWALFLGQSIFLLPSLFLVQLPSESCYKSLNREQWIKCSFGTI